MDYHYSNETSTDENNGTATVLLLVWVAINALLNGILLRALWITFVLNIFPDLPIVTVAQAIGLALFVGYFMPYTPDKNKLTMAYLGYVVYHCVIRMITIVIMAWSIAQFL